MIESDVSQYKLEDIKERISNMKIDPSTMTANDKAVIGQSIYLLKAIGYNPLNLGREREGVLSPEHIKQFINTVGRGSYDEGQYLALSSERDVSALGNVMGDITRLLPEDLFVRVPSGNKTQIVRDEFKKFKGYDINADKKTNDANAVLATSDIAKRYNAANIAEQQALFWQMIMPDVCFADDDLALKNVFESSFIPFLSPQQPAQEAAVLPCGGNVLHSENSRGNTQVPEYRAFPPKVIHVQVYDILKDSGVSNSIRRYNIAFCTGRQTGNLTFNNEQMGEIRTTLSGLLDQYSGDQLQEKIEQLVRSYPGSSLLVDENGLINKLINMGNVEPEEDYLAAYFISLEEDKQALRDLQAMSNWKNNYFDLMMKMPVEDMVELKESFLLMKRTRLFLESTLKVFSPAKLLLGLPFIFIPNILFIIGSLLRAAAYSLAMKSTHFTSFLNFLGMILQFPLGISHRIVTGNFELMVVRPSNTSLDLENYKNVLTQVEIATQATSKPTKMTSSSDIPVVDKSLVGKKPNMGSSHTDRPEHTSFNRVI